MDNNTWGMIMGDNGFIWAQLRKGVEHSWEKPQSSRLRVGRVMKRPSSTLELLQVDQNAKFHIRQFEKGVKKGVKKGQLTPTWFNLHLEEANINITK